MTMDQARMQTANPLYLGCLMVKVSDADGQVAGALNTTGNVLRPAFQIIKTLPGISVVSGAFIMLLPKGSKYGTNDILVFADCAVVPDPTAAELAQIAVSAAKTARDIAGIEPRVAMLSPPKAPPAILRSIRFSKQQKSLMRWNRLLSSTASFRYRCCHSSCRGKPEGSRQSAQRSCQCARVPLTSPLAI